MGGIGDMAKEPAKTVGIVVGLVVAAVALLVAFGISITDDQKNAIIGFVIALAAVGPIVSGFITRGKVYAPETVKRIEDDKLQEGKQIGRQLAAGQNPIRGSGRFGSPS